MCFCFTAPLLYFSLILHYETNGEYPGTTSNNTG
jgi:hypothetical protein